MSFQMDDAPQHLLPVEILENIVLEVDRPLDLLSMALCNKALLSSIIPSHMEFRDIQCDLKTLSIWKKLIQRPFLARRLRKLIVTSNPETTIPRMPPRAKPASGGVYDVAINMLAQVLRLTDLDIFRWDAGEIGFDRIAMLLDDLVATNIQLQELRLKLFVGRTFKGAPVFTEQKSLTRVR
ncbi:hypothetical protein M422DRAFT_219252 [Sphaerobolus stellatus SS14]|nr:hypothetical protein M422DRAFT_219252 [Sphaerobolus stellatus SS14]